MKTQTVSTIIAAPPEAERTMLSILRSFPAPVWIIYLGTFINRFGTFVLPFLALHMTKLGYSISESGIAVAAYGAGHFVAAILGGHLADTLGRRNTIALSMFSGAISMMLLSGAESLAAFVAFAALAGMTSEFYRPASSALLIDLVGEENRVVAFATYRFAINIGWAFGPGVAGLLSQYSYFWLFVGDAATSTLFGIVALAGLPQLHKSQRADWHGMLRPFRSLRVACSAAFANRKFVRLLVAALATAIVFIQVFTTFGLEIKSAGHSEKVYGALLALNGVVIVLFEIPIASITRRREPRQMMACGFMLMGTGISLLSFGHSIQLLTIGMVILTFGEIIALPVIMAYVASIAPDEMRGRFMGVHGLAWALGFTIGPSLGMALYAWNPNAIWLLSGALGFFAAWVISRPEDS